MRELSQGGKIVSNAIKEAIPNELNEHLPAIKLMEEAMDKGEIVKMDPRQIILTVVGSSLFYFIGEPILRVLLLNEESFTYYTHVEWGFRLVFWNLLTYRGIQNNNTRC